MLLNYIFDLVFSELPFNPNSILKFKLSHSNNISHPYKKNKIILILYAIQPFTTEIYSRKLIERYFTDIPLQFYTYLNY
jgi:hypothetical protein